jgi:DNA (cytosine-5)-methyltransferase 1
MPNKESRAPQHTTKFAVVDLFAGPGGLAEGFSAVSDDKGHLPFKIVLSVEKDSAAHSTLLLRSFLRQFDASFPDEYYSFLQNGDEEPDWEKLYPDEWEAAKREAIQLELGPKKTQSIRGKVLEIRQNYGDRTILIGGPPCQAYSLIGRARNRGIADYDPEKDERHTLYKNYIQILNELCPAAFVMENVRGLLSSSLKKKQIFDLIRRDLELAGPGYKLLALNPQKDQMPELFESPIDASDFVVRAEDFGVPQARHRVIVIGIRGDLAERLTSSSDIPLLKPRSERATVRQVLESMPRLRTGLSRNDSQENWTRAIEEAGRMVDRTLGFLLTSERKVFRQRIRQCTDFTVRDTRRNWPRSALRPARLGPNCPTDLASWLSDSKLAVLPNNETRAHMPSDLARYLAPRCPLQSGESCFRAYGAR